MTPFQSALSHLQQQFAAGQANILSATRPPPMNIEAEQALLGALLSNNKAFDRLEGLEAEHFADPVHQRIFGHIRHLVERGELADVVTLRSWLERDPTFAEQGLTVEYVVQLLAATVSHINAGEYGKIIRETWRQREAIRIGAALIEGAHSADAETRAMVPIDAAADALHTLLVKEAGNFAPVPAAAAVQGTLATMAEAMTREHGVAGIPTGYAGLDRMLGGLQPTQLILIGGRPGMGKTAIGCGIAARAAASLPEHDGGQVIFITKEMLASQVLSRVVAAEAALPLTAVARAALEDAGGTWRRASSREYDTAYEAGMRLRDLPLQFLDDPERRWNRLAPRVRTLHRRRPIRLLVVDHLSLMRGTDGASRQNRNAEVSEITGSMKELAMELGIPVLLLSQLNRGVEQREDKKPQLSDLRDSGSIEQDADVVMFAYRHAYYLEKGEPVRLVKDSDETFSARLAGWQADLEQWRPKGEIIVAKQRQGATGPVRMRWDAQAATYWDEADDTRRGFIRPAPRRV